MAAVRDAGLTQIDHLITTHWHGDHYGAMAELASRIPIRHFLDHGPNIQPNANVDAFLQQTYPQLYGRARHTVVTPGDRVPMAGVEVRIVASAGAVLKTALPGGGQPNPLCAGMTAPDADPSENAQSAGSHVTFGRFRALHLGDLTANREFDLMCPANPLGTVDLFVVSHHGQPSSNSAALVHAVRPRVAIMNNGTRKGGQPEAMRVIYASPGLEDLWQLHFSLLSGQEYTVAGMFIANGVDDPPAALPVAPLPPPQPGAGGVPPPVHNGPAYWIKVSARQDGTFTVTNARNNASKTYRNAE
jgi:L-ascorbate metabolism protein UlaG (beta-lactamase superfamily)